MLNVDWKWLDSNEGYPCILYTNSLPTDGSEVHNKDKVGLTLRKFLNEYCAEHNIPNTQKFNENSLPIYELNGKLKLLHVYLVSFVVRCIALSTLFLLYF